MLLVFLLLYLLLLYFLFILFKLVELLIKLSQVYDLNFLFIFENTCVYIGKKSLWHSTTPIHYLQLLMKMNGRRMRIETRNKR